MAGQNKRQQSCTPWKYLPRLWVLIKMTLLAPLCKAWKRLSCLGPEPCSCATSFFRAAATSSSPPSSSSLLDPSLSSNFEEAKDCSRVSLTCHKDPENARLASVLEPNYHLINSYRFRYLRWLSAGYKQRSDVHACSKTTAQSAKLSLTPTCMCGFRIFTLQVCNRHIKHAFPPITGQCASKPQTPRTHLLGPVQLFSVLIEQIEGLRRALPLVHVACD